MTRNYGLLHITKIKNSKYEEQRLIASGLGREGLAKLVERRKQINDGDRCEILDLFTHQVMSQDDINKALR